MQEQQSIDRLAETLREHIMLAQTEEALEAKQLFIVFCEDHDPPRSYELRLCQIGREILEITHLHCDRKSRERGKQLVSAVHMVLGDVQHLQIHLKEAFQRFGMALVN